MKKIYLSILLPFAAIATCNAQQTINFEPGGVGQGYTWNVFENTTPPPPLEFVANPNPSGANTSATVAKFTSMLEGQPYAGTETSHANGMADFVLTAENSIITIMVYKSVISDVGVKLVTPTGAAQGEIKIANTLINQWEQLTFDFSGQVGAFTEPFDQIVVFPDFSPSPRTYGTVSYFDNISFGEADEPTEPMEPMVAAPNPMLPQSQVISMFSGVYTNVAVDTWLTSWSEAAMQEVMIQGNATKKYTNLNFAGVETVGPNLIDATEMDHFNVNVWSSDFTQLRIKLVDFGADMAFAGGDDTEHEVVFDNPAQGQWLTYSIPLSSFTGLMNRDNIAQLIFSSNGTSTVFVDNVYFSFEEDVTEPMEPMVAAPDPTLPQAQVISMFSGVYDNVPVNTWLTEWSEADLEEVMIQGNATKKYTNVNFAGVETVGENLIDATMMDHFNVNVWSSDFTQLRIKLVDFGADMAFAGGDDTEHEVVFEAPAQGEWITYSIPLADFTGLVNRDNVAQLIFSSNGTSTIFVDNVYFSTENTSGIAGFTAATAVMYPNPATSTLTLKGTNNIETVNVYNMLGQQVLHATPNTTEALLNVSQLQNGVYTVNATINGAITSQKFIKQ